MLSRLISFQKIINEKVFYESIEKVEENNQGPPQVWISKSLSMEHGLDEIDE